LNGLVVVFVVSSEIWRRRNARRRAIQKVEATASAQPSELASQPGSQD
jgi:hypothetical protein